DAMFLPVRGSLLGIPLELHCAVILVTQQFRLSIRGAWPARMRYSAGMKARTDDLRIERVRPLVSPAVLQEELPLPDAAAELIQRSRRAIERSLFGDDARLLVIVGPCSIHDPAAALEYAQRLHDVVPQYAGTLQIVMRVYFEKPRTVLGWKGLINDPGLD